MKHVFTLSIERFIFLLLIPTTSYAAFAHFDVNELFGCARVRIGLQIHATTPLPEDSSSNFGDDEDELPGYVEKRIGILLKVEQTEN